jgi:protein-S-isoprenylcysteine O-methyltransferase Ste14
MAATASDLRHPAWRANLLFLVGMWALLFPPAWTLRYWQAWVYWLIYAAMVVAGTHYFLKHDPKLVERRLAVGPGAERETTQKIIMTVALACFILSLIIPGIDHRLHWSAVPPWLVLLGNAGVVLGYAVIFIVVRENSFAAATIRVESEQPVISSGPYAIVRHPMYSGALLMLGITPLALGSYWGLLMVVPIFAALAWRLLDEERFLTRNLPGYADYCQRVRFRLIPGIW